MSSSTAVWCDHGPEDVTAPAPRFLSLARTPFLAPGRAVVTFVGSDACDLLVGRIVGGSFDGFNAGSDLSLMDHRRLSRRDFGARAARSCSVTHAGLLVAGLACSLGVCTGSAIGAGPDRHSSRSCSCRPAPRSRALTRAAGAKPGDQAIPRRFPVSRTRRASPGSGPATSTNAEPCRGCVPPRGDTVRRIVPRAALKRCPRPPQSPGRCMAA